MKTKKLLGILLACVLAVSCLGLAGAAAAGRAVGTQKILVPDDPEAPMALLTEGKLETLYPEGKRPKTGDVYMPKDPDAPMMTLTDEDGSVLPLASGKLHIPVTNYTSSTDDYNESFSCDPKDGNRLNIWVKNNGEDTIVLNVDYSKFFGIVNEQYSAVEILGGHAHTMTFSYKDDKGIDGNWDVNVTTLAGGTLDITVSARQYQYNG